MKTEPNNKGLLKYMEGHHLVYHRARKLSSFSRTKNGLRLKCRTAQHMNQYYQTHETRLFQFEDLKKSGKTLNIEIEFFTEEIFRVRFSDTALPTKAPAFPPKEYSMMIAEPEKGIKLKVKETKTVLEISSSKITLQIQKDPFHMQAVDSKGKCFWSQRRNEMFTSDIFDMSTVHAKKDTACFEALEIRPKEELYGLGERFDHAARRGKETDFWNKDGVGTSNRRAYINIPFIMSTRGYGLFLNSSTRMQWEPGTREAFTLGFGVEETHMDYFVIHGPDPAQILKRYQFLTGSAPVPPVWSFGLWMSRNTYMSWDIVKGVAKGMRKHKIPCDVLHLDPAYSRQRTKGWSFDMRFNSPDFADPEETMSKLKEDGFRTSIWVFNFVPPHKLNINYAEGKKLGYFAKDKKGKVWKDPDPTDGIWHDHAVIDFSNPKAAKWYADQIKKLIKLGGAVIKTDFAEGIPEDAKFKNISAKRFHNLYSLVYNAVVSDAIWEVNGEGLVWGRSGTAGSQRYPVQWGGDPQATYNGLAGTLRGSLSMGLSGVPFFSHDIGGFFGRPSPELYVRWAQLGLFSSHSRCHGQGVDNYREPWTFGKEACAIFKKFTELRYKLLPYIYEQAKVSSKTAKPMVRHMVIEAPKDPNVWHLEDQYMFGDSMLVAPILEPMTLSKKRCVYLPKGAWFDYWTKKKIVSKGEWICANINLKTMPIYVKDGAVIPYTKIRQHTNNEVGEVVKVEVYGKGKNPKGKVKTVVYK